MRWVNEAAPPLRLQWMRSVSYPGGWKKGLNEEVPEFVWSPCLDCPSHTPEAHTCVFCVVVVVDVAERSADLWDVTTQHFYEQRVAHQTQFIRIHKAMELLLLLCAACKSAWEALMRAQSAQECRLKVSRHKHCSGWGGATSKKSAKPQSAGPVFSLYLPSFFFLLFLDFPFQTSVLLNIFLKDRCETSS